MFPTSINLKPGQKLINLDKMPSFYQLEPPQKMIDLSKMPKFDFPAVDFALDSSFQELTLKGQDCL